MIYHMFWQALFIVCAELCAASGEPSISRPSPVLEKAAPKEAHKSEAALSVFAAKPYSGGSQVLAIGKGQEAFASARSSDLGRAGGGSYCRASA